MSRIDFDYVHAKNFRSYDNLGIRIDLSGRGTTLLASSENGSGKSTGVVHALYYALFDKPFSKDGKKSGYVNSRSNKDCLVEVGFRTQGSEWKVRRGMKPSVFEIERDGVLLLDEAAKKDFQKYLVESVLGFDDATFTSAMVLGKDKFVPFIQMGAPARRAYAEQMIDLVVFSRMNEEAKNDLKLHKNDLAQVNYEIGILGNSINMGQSLIDSLDATIRSATEQVDGKIADAQASIDKAERAKAEAMRRASVLNDEASDVGYDRTAHQNAMAALQRLSTTENELRQRLSKWEHLKECPTCGQSIGPELIETMIGEDRTKLERLTNPEARKMIDEKIAAMVDAEKLQSEKLAEASKYNTMVATLDTSIAGYRREIAILEQMKAKTDESERLTKAEQEQSERQKQMLTLQDRCDKVTEEIKNHDALIAMLKDDAVKADIIRQFVPMLNNKTNEYLADMNLYAQIKFDETFDVELLSPTRKGQGVAELSDGQKMRINLATMFAWRDISRSKSSLDTNLLVMDEILEALSGTGVSDFMSLYEAKLSGGTNLFVVTQRGDEFADYFDQTIYFTLKDDHTVVV